MQCAVSPLSTDVVFLSFGLILFTKPTYTSTSFIDLAMSSLPISKYVNELDGKQINFKESSETSCLCKSCECLKILNNHWILFFFESRNDDFSEKSIDEKERNGD